MSYSQACDQANRLNAEEKTDAANNYRHISARFEAKPDENGEYRVVGYRTRFF